MFKTLRARLTAWYLAFFLVSFAVFSLLLYAALSRALERRLDQNLASQANTATALMREELDEMRGDALRAAKDVLSEMQPRDNLIAILEGNAPLAASGPITGPIFGPGLASPDPPAANSPATWALPRWGSHGARAVANRFTWSNRAFAIVAISPLDFIAADLQTLRQALLLAVLPLLALAAFGGHLLARRGLAPLAAMSAQTQRITSENLSARLAIGNAAEEMALLATSFNALLARLDQSFDTMRRFVQDASHEIRTPLAVIRGEADVALSRARAASEYRESLAVIQEESRRLSRLVEDLLNLARADAGRVQLRLENLYVNDLVAECCRSVEPLAAARNLTLACNASADIPFRGDEELLRRMVLNLLDNAIRYTPPGGRISAAVESQNGEIRIRVADTGIGIPPESVPHVFERFYRADQSRSRNGSTAGSFGLGLSIVKWIAESHHGVVELASQPGAGSTFTVRLQS
ncbi:MAG TPA: heavy metal sensor histidine kinase [Bryobacteraceae bacterium]|nr:heavy metal sensor histidine kinase [Bryobacteraceae bacterium]